MNDLISVIIPVYNTASYLRKCFDSILEQTYKNLEVIVVDDGSTDGSGSICDEYAAKDGRIKVIHQQNGGVSSARNEGLAAATGDYIGWVDSDDWVEPDMFEYLLSKIHEYEADISVCGRYECSPQETEIIAFDEEIVIDRVTATRMLIEDELLRNYVWDKLYTREVFSGIRFSDNRKHEDFLVMTDVINKADRIALLTECKYYYILREDSDSHSKDPGFLFTYFKAHVDRRTHLLDTGKYDKERIDRVCLIVALDFLFGFLPLPRSAQMKYLNEYGYVARFIEENYRPETYDRYFGFTGRKILKAAHRHTDRPVFSMRIIARIKRSGAE